MRATYLEICGFRSYGAEPQRIDLAAPLAVVHADNSQGKTSLAEAVEFLYTGATTRRLLLGGSPSEFHGALRNVHLLTTARVYVELGLADGGATIRVIRRELLSDYKGASDCTSLLTVDGTPVDDITAAGLPLSEPPLAAPVLLEHTLRYAVSAKPGERSDYFKAILEVTDLELVRTEITALIAEREAVPRDRLLSVFADASDTPLFASALDPLKRTNEPAEVEQALRTACYAVVSPPEEGVALEPLTKAAERLSKALENRQRDILPISDLVSPMPELSGITEEDSATEELDQNSKSPADRLLEAAVKYGDHVAAVETATAEVLPLLQAALKIDRLNNIEDNHSENCPLCLTPDALNDSRIAAIRIEVANRQELSAGSVQIQEKVRVLAEETQNIARIAANAVPESSRWSSTVRDSHVASAVQLGTTEGQLESLLTQADKLATLAESIRVTEIGVQEALSVLLEHTKRLRALPVEHLEVAVESLRELSVKARSMYVLHDQLISAVVPFNDVVHPQLEAGSDTAGWDSVRTLASQPAELSRVLSEQRRRSVAIERLRQAAKQIDSGVQTVLDRRLLKMRDEIGRWWGLLRPDELTTFDSIVRRGTGRKYLDVTAALAPQPAMDGVVRNALAVLSNSQLNGLGLSAFLARCRLQSTPLIVLDDPIPGSDREHRNTFASDVVAALLDVGQQVLVTTHDSELARHLHTSHQHCGVDEFKASLVDPRAGTELLRTGDDFERLMLDASSQMYSPLHANRRAAGNSLRIAAERLAKQVTVAGRRRAGDSGAVLANYDKKNLKDLRALAIAYAVQPNEPGQWQQLARTLNDADHDTLEPPHPAELKQCHSTLRELKRRHAEIDPGLMRP